MVEVKQIKDQSGETQADLFTHYLKPSLVLNSTTMRAIFEAGVFMKLSEESQTKVEMIYEIAAMLASYQQPILTTAEFDMLYDKPVDQIQVMSRYVKAQCHATVYPNIEGE
jgi:hypothetical protein